MTPTPDQVAQWAREAGVPFRWATETTSTLPSTEELHRLVTRAMAEQVELCAKENRAIRRRWCLDVCPTAYMDDGEAQDSTAHPSIDYLRDSLETIIGKRRERQAAAIRANAPKVNT